MRIDAIESNSFDKASFDVNERLASLKNGFDSKLAAREGVFIGASPLISYSVAHWLGMTDAAALQNYEASAFDILQNMYEGHDANGIKTLGLKEISNWAINEQYRIQNMKQHAGYAAEVISTAKENLFATVHDTGLTTYRADDLPDLFVKNDQYVDKVRINTAGEIVERIQTKFVGNDGASCLNRLLGKNFEKYLDKVDKIEIPRDYYKQIRQEGLIEKEIDKLQKQIDRLTLDGKTEIVEQKMHRLEKLKKLDSMIEESTVSSKEAIFATNHPKAYSSLVVGNGEGLKTGFTAAIFTAAISTVDNFQGYMNGEQTALEAFGSVAKDTGAAGALGYGTGFISSAVSMGMEHSSHQLIKSLAAANVPAAVITVGVTSYDSLSDFAQGNIDGTELAYDLGNNMVGLAGSQVGAQAGAVAGAAIGSVVPGAGTAVGAMAGQFVGGMVGYAITSGAYQTAVEYGSSHAGELAEKAKAYASDTLDMARQTSPESVDQIREEINRFAEDNQLPFRFE